MLRELGVDQVIDYTTTRFEEVVTQVDVVLDTVGGETLARSFEVVRPGGIVVSIVDHSAKQRAAGSGIRGERILVTPDAAQLVELAHLIDADKLRPVVETVLPLTETRRAHELSESHHTRGKIVLRVAE